MCRVFNRGFHKGVGGATTARRQRLNTLSSVAPLRLFNLGARLRG